MFTSNVGVILMIAVDVWVEESPKRATLDEPRDLVRNPSLKQERSYSQKRGSPERIVVGNVTSPKPAQTTYLVGKAGRLPDDINNDTSPVPPKVTIIHEERSEFSELYLPTRMFP